jgi:hypothetical protein
MQTPQEREQFDKHVVEQYRRSLMQDAVKITREFEDAALYWRGHPQHFVCGNADVINLETIQYCAEQISGTIKEIK